MEQNGMFLENSKYNIWIIHKKLAQDEIVTIIHISIHISFNIGPRILNSYNPEYPFPSAVHIYFLNMDFLLIMKHTGMKIAMHVA